MATVFLKNSANSVRQLHEVINSLQEDFDNLQRDFRAANPAIDRSLKNHAEQFHRLYSRIEGILDQLLQLFDIKVDSGRRLDPLSYDMDHSYHTNLLKRFRLPDNPYFAILGLNLDIYVLQNGHLGEKNWRAS